MPEIRVILTDEMWKKVEKKADFIGAKSTDYVKFLIIQDLKEGDAR